MILFVLHFTLLAGTYKSCITFSPLRTTTRPKEEKIWKTILTKLVKSVRGLPLADRMMSPSCSCPHCMAASSGNSCLMKMNPSYSKMLNPNPRLPLRKFTSKIESENVNKTSEYFKTFMMAENFKHRLAGHKSRTFRSS